MPDGGAEYPNDPNIFTNDNPEGVETRGAGRGGEYLQLQRTVPPGWIESGGSAYDMPSRYGTNTNTTSRYDTSMYSDRTRPQTVDQYFAAGQSRREARRTNPNPYADSLEGILKASPKLSKGLPRGFNEGAQAALYRQGGMELSPAWAQRADAFNRQVSPDAARSLAHKLAKARNTQKNIQIAQTIISGLAMGAGGFAAGAGPLVQAGVGAGGAAANVGAQSAITGKFDPASAAAQVAAGALPGAVGATGVSPVVGGAISGAGGALLRGAASGNIDWLDVARGGATGAGSGAMRQSGAPPWADPLIRQAEGPVYNWARGRGAPTAQSTGQSLMNRIPGFANTRQQDPSQGLL